MNPQPIPHNPESEVPPHEERRFRLGPIAVVAALLTALAFAAGILPRIQARQAVARETRELSIPTIAVVSPAPGTASAGIELPA